VHSDGLGFAIRSARKRRSMTQAQLGAHIGVSSRTIGSWERGESRPDNYGLERIRETLGAVVTSTVPPAVAVAVPVDVVEAISRDTSLDDETRLHLIRQYVLLREVAATRRGEPPPVVDPQDGHREAGVPAAASLTPTTPSQTSE
jgi:transcriptional regulator with XRE-family HTH domain